MGYAGRPTVLLNKKGVTLVEVMISLVILLFVFVGLIQVSVLSIDFNRKNAIRDEGVRIAAEVMTNLRAYDFSTNELADTGGWIRPFPVPVTSDTVRRTIGNFPQDFAVQKNIITLDPPTNTLKQVSVRVQYTYRNEPQVTYTINANIRAKVK